MDVGILLSFLNQRYFRDALSTYCEFIPQMVFLNGLFGYLSLLIVGKWISGSTADLYHVMIYMFLSPGSGGLKCADGSGGYGCAENEMFPGQGPLQVILPCCASSLWGLMSSIRPVMSMLLHCMPAQVKGANAGSSGCCRTHEFCPQELFCLLANQTCTRYGTRYGSRPSDHLTSGVVPLHDHACLCRSFWCWRQSSRCPSCWCPSPSS